MKSLNEDKFDKMAKDPRCRENMFRPIDKKQCRNNCKWYNGKNCALGYWKRPERK